MKNNPPQVTGGVKAQGHKSIQLRLKEQETLGVSSAGSLPFSVSSVPEGWEKPPEHGVWWGPVAGGNRSHLKVTQWTLAHQHGANHISLK